MDGISIVLCGEAGQGIQTAETILTRVFKAAGYRVHAAKEYMSRIRGGANSTEIRVGARHAAFLDRMDVLVPLGPGAVDWVAPRVGKNTLILGDREELAGEMDRAGAAVEDLPLGRMSREAGGRIYGTTIAAGALAALFGVDPALLEQCLRGRFGGKGEKVLGANLEAAARGHAAGKAIAASRGGFEPQRDPAVSGEMLVDGGQAVALGAIAGGCRFIASYPMSPSTPVLVFLARHARDFGIVVEQAEDEIAAVNMGLGAWYAGARAMVTTSGGGFALMTEGLSLAGMHESPMVIHLGQRPGPATGLPTRTEQADLLHVLHAGHGEFPRAVFAPGTVEEAFRLTRKAFDLADRFQVPVFILTDQHFVDGICTAPPFDAGGARTSRSIVRTAADYRRYRITGNGLSPRGIPGFGEGLVVAGSDEHDEEGHITEDRRVRKAMVEKRLCKGGLLVNDAVPPTLIGEPEFRTLVVGWGSTRHPVTEALERLGRDDVAFLHFSQVWPLHPSAASCLGRAGRIVSVENNATAQFTGLLEAHAGSRVDERILKYDGSPFSVEELAGKLGEAVA